MKIDGFTPLFDVLLDTEGVYTAAIYGKYWRYCNWSETGECTASNERIAKELGINVRTVQREKSRLEGKHFISVRMRPGKTDAISVRHELVLEFALKRIEPPHVGGDTDDQEGMTESHPTHDTQSPKDSSLDSLEDTNLLSNDNGEPDPFDLIATPAHKIVQGLHGGVVTIDEAQLIEEMDRHGQFSDLPEPEYVEPGDEFGDKQKSKHPKWKVPKTPLTKRALTACGRKLFKSREERATWNRIEKSMVPFTSMTEKAVMHTEWVEEKLIFIEKDNLKYQSARTTHAVKWTFPKFLSMINNEEARQDWIAHRRTE